MHSVRSPVQLELRTGGQESPLAIMEVMSFIGHAWRHVHEFTLRTDKRIADGAGTPR